MAYEIKLGADPQPQGRHNHGKPWDDAQCKLLRRLWTTTEMDVDAICNSMGRSYASILAKLSSYGFIRCDISGQCYVYDKPRPWNTNRSDTITINELHGAPTMATHKNIETKTFIRGRDATGMTDSEIFELIKEIENEICGNEQIKNRPKKLDARILELQADIQKLVDYVDAR